MKNLTFAEAEQQINAYWKKHNVFVRSVLERPLDKQFSFYDGPPFATGLPHYGHIVASTIKDVVPRYATMRGYRVERRWGWDCHGLPVENLIEKELGLKTKQDIEAIGIAKFNETCQASVLKYTNEWRTTIERLGRWVDMDNDYRTMDPSFMESVWWVFKQLYERGLIYEGRKAMHVCPRCVTPLANFEVALGYKDVEDLAVTWKFRLVDQPDTYVLAWTTTPWSTPGTVGLSVGPNYKYVKAKIGNEFVILVIDRVEIVLAGKEFTIVDEMSGSALVGMKYEPLINSYAVLPEAMTGSNLYQIFAGNYVEVTEGTGVVTINGSYGEIDMQAAAKNGLPLIMDVDMNGVYNDKAGIYAGLPVKEGQKKVIADAQAANLVFKTEPYIHSYPHCWRCDTALLNYATTSWFVKVTTIKEQMLQNNEQVTWMPEHVKNGRFGKWLEGAKDWAISRERYWGAPLPIWKSKDGEILCIGSKTELEQLADTKLTDLHKQYVDDVVIHKDGKEYHRIAAVLDCWFESGSMPYAQAHFPFENESEFMQTFPADFIAEGLDQTRGWFYTLIVLSTALFNKPAAKNIIVNGLVLAADGKKMSKRLKNYPEPNVVLDKYGADALRFYLMSSPVVRAEDLRFSEKGVDLVLKKVIMTLWNINSFYQLFAGTVDSAVLTDNPNTTSTNIMDRWVLALLADTTERVTAAMDHYDLAEATRVLEQTVQEISTWYVRRSRDRFKGTAAEKIPALQTLATALDTLVKLLAPFTPFLAERIYLQLHSAAEPAGDSVHLQAWPKVIENQRDTNLLKNMVTARELVEVILAQREVAGLKVRQPLADVAVPNLAEISEELQAVICAEVNVKALTAGAEVKLNTVLTPELTAEGLVREFVRGVNALRKEQKLSIHDQVILTYQTTDTALQAVIAKQSAQMSTAVLAKQLVATDVVQPHSLTLNGHGLTVSLVK
ncbi:MAG: hypothetical protein ACD_43C00194G0001 [uncultured bacterium]|nr:MAG: hypothetical protein ACD_43C00194G0001 [uncultured bacterium]